MAAMMSTRWKFLSKNLLLYITKRTTHGSSKNNLWKYYYTTGRILPTKQIVHNDQSSNCHQSQFSSLLAVRKHFHTSFINFESITIKVPAFAESVSEGDVRWEKAVGDVVEMDELICEIETDKTAIPVNAPFSGVIEEILVEDGTTVTAGTPIFRISAKGDVATPKAAETKAPPPPSPQTEPPIPQPTPDPPPTAISPIPTVPPFPPSEAPQPGQPMSTTPIEEVIPKPYKVPTPTTTSPARPAPGSQITGTRTEQRVKMHRMRQRIAQRLKDAQNINAMLTTFNEIDMTNIMEMRAKHKESFLKRHNIKLGFMSAFVKAAAYALQDQPVVNAVIDEQEIVYRDYIDISVAVATPKGLVVPVIRNVEKMNFSDIERTINALGEKARTGSLAIEDMDGGTFTISNGGVFGSMFGTPIINPPQSAILGMHAIFDRPVAINGKVEIRPMMYVALTYDHRLIDGREGVLFLKKIKQSVEDCRILLLDI